MSSETSNSNIVTLPEQPRTTRTKEPNGDKIAFLIAGVMLMIVLLAKVMVHFGIQF